MQYFVYFLQSLKNGDIYVGSTSNLKRRVATHNSGRVRSTKAYKPWVLIKSIVYKSKTEAVRKELFYKTGQQKELLRKNMARWRSGNAGVCKTLTQGFDSPPGLN